MTAVVDGMEAKCLWHGVCNNTPRVRMAERIVSGSLVMLAFRTFANHNVRTSATALADTSRFDALRSYKNDLAIHARHQSYYGTCLRIAAIKQRINHERLLK